MDEQGVVLQCLESHEQLFSEYRIRGQKLPRRRGAGASGTNEKRSTVRSLHIDRGFINAIGTETITSPVLDAVLTLAKRLNMLTVAEGVETPEQARWLSERGVNFMQGYWISRPLPLDDFVRWLKKPYTPQW